MDRYDHKAGTFDDLFKSIQECKLSMTCSDRHVRQYYYENENTASEYPVMFICESPSTRGGYGNGSVRETCWMNTAEDHHFRSMLKEMGFEGAYITNFVKCGTKTKCKPTKYNLDKCLQFLLREIDIVKPRVIACVGKKLLGFAKKHLRDKAVILYVYHYSWSKRKGLYIPEKELASYQEIKRIFSNHSLHLDAATPRR